MANMAKKQSLALALITSFIVMVVGAMIWGILYYYGIFCVWVAFISSFCAGLVYSCFYKKRNAGFYSWIIVWSLILNLLSMLLTIVISIEINNGLSFQEALSLFGPFVTSENVKGYFIRDILLSAGFTFIGGIFLLLSYRLNPKNKKTVESVSEEEIAGPKVQPKIEKYVQDEEPKKEEKKDSKNAKDDKEAKTVGDFYVKEVAKIVALKDSKLIKKKQDEFDAKYIAKMSGQMKKRVLNYLLEQKYSGNQLKAAKIIILKLK